MAATASMQPVIHGLSAGCCISGHDFHAYAEHLSRHGPEVRPAFIVAKMVTTR
jgi:hypothetical protein